MSQIAPYSRLDDQAPANPFFGEQLRGRFNPFFAKQTGTDSNFAGQQDNSSTDNGEGVDTLDFNKRLAFLNRETMLEFMQKHLRGMKREGLHLVADKCVEYFLEHGSIPPASQIDQFEKQMKLEREKALKMKRACAPQPPWVRG